jgi:DNA-binding transcriptional MerR regulator
MSEYLLISDAAKEVQVESHVLRYWEEELHLPIKRNELGHRYYTTEDVERFKQIKSMKERGLQLKAIKMILKDGKLDVLPENDTVMQTENIPERRTGNDMMLNTQTAAENAEDKAKRLQWLLKQLIRETLEENNRELCREIKENVVKELDYQFRVQEERDDERERKQCERNEEYYKRMDELLRNKSTAKKIKIGKRHSKS